MATEQHSGDNRITLPCKSNFFTMVAMSTCVIIRLARGLFMLTRFWDSMAPRISP